MYLTFFIALKNDLAVYKRSVKKNRIEIKNLHCHDRASDHTQLTNVDCFRTDVHKHSNK